MIHTSKRFVYNYATIQKRNTRIWKIYEFLAPLCEKGFVEFNLQAHFENFTICNVEAIPFIEKGKVSFYALRGEITDSTFPYSLMVYLPILQGKQTLTVQTNSYGRSIRIEIFEGVIQPQARIRWWENHKRVACSEKRCNPSLIWKTERSGLYTLVITYNGCFAPDMKVDFQITIEGGDI